MREKTRVIQYGLGAMGVGMVKMMLEKKDIEIVAAISGSGRNVGIDLGEAIGLNANLEVEISDDAERIFKSVEADVVMHATCSKFEDVFKQTASAIKNKKNVITIAEEAAYPINGNLVYAQKIDQLAKEANVSFVGTGINPGFMFDFLPISVSGVMRSIDKIKIRRVANFSKYGLSVWQHIGVGKSMADFEKGINSGDIVLHVGLHETVALAAAGLNWELTDYHETKEPIITQIDRETEHGKIIPGQTCGFRQVGKGWHKDKLIITQEIIGIINPDKDEDGFSVGIELWLEGNPNAHVVIEDALAEQGGIGTYAHAVNTIPQIISSKPGYVTVLDLPPAACLV